MVFYKKKYILALRVLFDPFYVNYIPKFKFEVSHHSQGNLIGASIRLPCPSKLCRWIRITHYWSSTTYPLFLLFIFPKWAWIWLWRLMRLFLRNSLRNAFQFIVIFRWNYFYSSNLKEIWDEISSVQVRFNILFYLY